MNVTKNPRYECKKKILWLKSIAPKIVIVDVKKKFLIVDSIFFNL